MILTSVRRPHFECNDPLRHHTDTHQVVACVASLLERCSVLTWQSAASRISP